MSQVKKTRWKWVVGIVLLLVVVGVILHWPGRVPIEISRETTYITGPLNPDGTVDYVAYLDQLTSQGVTKDNNAAVLLLQAIGPDALPDETRDEILDRLDMPALPEDGEYFVRFDAFAESRSENAEDYERLERQYHDAQRCLCTAEDHPVVAEWIEANAKPLGLVVAATRRPKFYIPLVSLSDPPGLFDIPLTSLGPCRAAARALVIRAMLRLDAGDTNGAIDDLLSCHRLARLLGQRFCLIYDFTSIAIERLACDADCMLLDTGILSGEQARTLLAELEALPPMPSIADATDVGERLWDLGLMLWQHNRSEGGRPCGCAKHMLLSTSGLDMNVVLTTFNRWYDRVVAGMKEPTFTERNAAITQWAQDLQRVSDQAEPIHVPCPVVKLTAMRLVGRALRRQTSQLVAELWLSVGLPNLGRAAPLYDDARMRLELAKVAAALAAYKAENGAYPERLEALSPAYMKSITNDLFIEKPLHYERVGDSFLLRSVGPNMAVDKKDATERPDKDDLVLPLPPQPEEQASE